MTLRDWHFASVAFAVFCCVACAADTLLPHVVLVDGQDELADGARAWRELGFRFDGAGARECFRRWYDEPRELECNITIGFVRDPLLRERMGADAMSNRDTRTVTVDADVTDSFELLIAGAHEVGHIVLDTPDHTVGGVMGGADWSLHDVDRELACSTIGVCQ